MKYSQCWELVWMDISSAGSRAGWMIPSDSLTVRLGGAGQGSRAGV